MSNKGRPPGTQAEVPLGVFTVSLSGQEKHGNSSRLYPYAHPRARGRRVSACGPGPRGMSQAVDSIDERCEVEEDWWKDNPVVRMYYRVTLEDGQQLTIFRNTVHGMVSTLRRPGTAQM